MATEASSRRRSLVQTQLNFGPKKEKRYNDEDGEEKSVSQLLIVPSNPKKGENLWVHYPLFFKASYFQLLMDQVSKLTAVHPIGKDSSILSPRTSCVFSNVDQKGYFYSGSIPPASWEDSPLVSELKELVETFINSKPELHQGKLRKFAYCLFHVYRDGSDYIGWHSGELQPTSRYNIIMCATDREAMHTMVASISFGTPRMFQFAPAPPPNDVKKKHKYIICKSLILNSGDLLIMKDGCQKDLSHRVAKETSIKTPRVNLTFREYQGHDQLPNSVYGVARQ
jgi:alkylated DNA repair dioxygenase AlkB